MLPPNSDVAAGLGASAGFAAPNNPAPLVEAPPPKRLVALFWDASLSAGGGPAGVVELPKLSRPVFAAGVVDPAGGAVVFALDPPPKRFVVVGFAPAPKSPDPPVDAPPPPKSPPVEGVVEVVEAPTAG